VSSSDEPALFASPPMPLRRLVFWMALAGLLLLLLGLLVVALPDSVSGPVVWTFSADHGLRQADVIGSAMLATGSALTWLMLLIWQWRYTR
jgi:hypothetical protein